MKNIHNKIISLLLILLIIFSVLSISPLTTVAETNDSQLSVGSSDKYGLPDKIDDGAILHTWCWSFNTIKENLENIAEAGYKSVQTSPINKCLVGDNGGMDLMGNGKWYYHYQPILYTIGNYQLGTLEEFKSMCSEADNYGIKIIVDVVANHCSSDYNSISSEIKDLPGDAFHSSFSIGDYGNRYQCTQGQLLSLYDLNTQNTNVQQMILNYLKSCVSAGADGFRYDAAKHIELPDDKPVDGKDFASDFWPVVLDNGSEFQYGEILQGSGSRIDAYSEYMHVTASSYGGVLRNSVSSGELNSNNLTDYKSDGAPTDKLVTWVESHDNYTGDGTWSNLNNKQIRQAWAIISARGDTTPLFFNRPDGSSTNSQWGNNKIGPTGDDNYRHPEVVAVNQFRNQMVGLPNTLTNPTSDNHLLMIERGSAGAVIINTSDKDIELDCASGVSDGTYTDEVSGNIFTIESGKINGTVNAGSIAVIYNSNMVKYPVVSISKNGGSFKGKQTLKLTCYNTTVSTYQIGDNPPISFKSGDSITIGENMAENSSVDVTLYGKNENGEVSHTYTFTKISTPQLPGETVIYFDNENYNWSTVNVYAYYYSNDGVVNNGGWPGGEMTDLGGNIYGYVLDENWDYSKAYIIFNDGAGTQYPGGEGYEITKGEKKIFNGNGLDDYSTIITTTEASSVPTSSGDINEYYYGDLNSDKSIDVRDATYIQKAIAGIYQLNDIQKKLSDVNSDSSIDVRDATLIQKHIAGLVTTTIIGEKF